MFITTFAQNYYKNLKNQEGATACPQTHKEMPVFRLK
jgi:hypothetical protein